MPTKTPVPESKLLATLRRSGFPTKEEFRDLVIRLENHRVLAKVFILEGTPFVFKSSPMKYVIFREQVADLFDIGSQEVCIVGSAKLGYSVAPSSASFGTPFSEASDVDVVIISEELFTRGSRELFDSLRDTPPKIREVYDYLAAGNGDNEIKTPPSFDYIRWVTIKNAMRNFVFNNFNPGNLPDRHPLQREIFDKIGSTSGLFLALEPQVFVSKIRARIFRNWRAAEDYYSHNLLELKKALRGTLSPVDETDADEIVEGLDAISSEKLEMAPVDASDRDTDKAHSNRTSLSFSSEKSDHTISVDFPRCRGKELPTVTAKISGPVNADEIDITYGQLSRSNVKIHFRLKNGKMLPPGDYVCEYTVRSAKVTRIS